MRFHKLFFIFLLTPALVGFVFSYGLTNNKWPEFPQVTPWVAPKSADSLVNIYKTNPTAIIEGKKVFNANCIVCHGESGRGDGESGFGLSVPPGDFSDPNFILESDGSIFWKITNGRSPMPSYEFILTDLQRWQLVSFIRSTQVPAVKKSKKNNSK